MARTKRPANVVGPQVRKRRDELRLTQEELAAQCQLGGLDISRGTLSQIESQLRRVIDDELLAAGAGAGLRSGMTWSPLRKTSGPASSS